MSEMKKTGKLINKIRGRTDAAAAGYLERGWVIANHIGVWLGFWVFFSFYFRLS